MPRPSTSTILITAPVQQTPAMHASRRTDNPALAQTGSLSGQTHSGNTAVPRVAALIDANGNVIPQLRSTTSTIKMMHAAPICSRWSQHLRFRPGMQKLGSADNLCDLASNLFDNAMGVYLTTLGANNYLGTNNPTAITGPDNGPTGCTNLSTCTSSEDTRMVQIYNNTLYVSMDSKPGGTGYNRSLYRHAGRSSGDLRVQLHRRRSRLRNGIRPIWPGLDTRTRQHWRNGQVHHQYRGSGNTSNGNNLNAGLKVNLSPQNFFFASPTVLYVADTGFPKNTSNGPDAVCTTDGGKSSATVGDGGLQKWILNPTVTAGLDDKGSAGPRPLRPEHSPRARLVLRLREPVIPAGTTITAVSGAGANATMSADATVTKQRERHRPRDGA